MNTFESNLSHSSNLKSTPDNNFPIPENSKSEEIVTFEELYNKDENFRKFYEQSALWQVRNYTPKMITDDGYNLNNLSPDNYFIRENGEEGDQRPSVWLNENNLGGISLSGFQEHIKKKYLGSHQ